MISNADYDYLFKIVMIGDSGVGKSNIVKRMCKNQFDFESKPTIGVEFTTKNITIGSSTIKLQIWDTAGREKYKAITSAYLRGTVGALLIYDISNEVSFKNLEKHLKEILLYAEPNVAIMLIGNKCDQQDLRQVKIEDAIAFAENNKLTFLETSALDATNVEIAFQNLSTGYPYLFLQKIYNSMGSKLTKEEQVNQMLNNSKYDKIALYKQDNKSKSTKVHAFTLSECQTF